MYIIVTTQQIQEIQALLLGTSWNLLSSIFDPRLIESTDAKSRDAEETVNELILNRTIKWQGQDSSSSLFNAAG